MVIQFGKYKGEDFDDIPLGYIKWLEQQEDLKPEIRMECQHQIQARDSDRNSVGRSIWKDGKGGL